MWAGNRTGPRRFQEDTLRQKTSGCWIHSASLRDFAAELSLLGAALPGRCPTCRPPSGAAQGQTSKAASPQGPAGHPPAVPCCAARIPRGARSCPPSGDLATLAHRQPGQDGRHSALTLPSLPPGQQMRRIKAEQMSELGSQERVSFPYFHNQTLQKFQN